ncbi:MAG: glycosyltransferase [Clostridia bacterium]|nr:glycosyltransferase [Clostridia bacterium]
MEEKKLSIGFFNDSFFPLIDGVVMVVDNYAKRLAKDCDVTVFVPRDGNKTDDSQYNYKVVRCLCIKIPFFDYYLPLPLFDFKFRKALKESNLDLVHIHSPFPMGRFGLKYAKKHSLPTVASMHSQFRKDFVRYAKIGFLADVLTKRIISVFNKCDQCWAVSSAVAWIYHAQYHCRDYPLVSGNATEMKPVSDPADSQKRIRELHGIREGERILLYVGRINKLKNVFLLADCAKILSKKKTVPFRLLFVGSGQDEDALKKYVRKLKIEGFVIFCGKIADRELLADYFAASDLFLFPSFYDTSSLVQIEAASQKTPTVFIRGTATASEINNGVNGFISGSDAKLFTDTIEKALADTELLRKVGENAFRDLYVTWDTRVEQALQRYHTLRENKSKKSGEQ